MNPNKIAAGFPRVDTGLASEQEKEVVSDLIAKDDAFRDFKWRWAMALIRKSVQPHTRPAQSEIEKRRAKNKRARVARRVMRHAA